MDGHEDRPLPVVGLVVGGERLRSEGDVDYLADVEGGYGVIDAGIGAFYGFVSNTVEFAGSVGALYGRDAVGGVDTMQEGAHENAEQGERNPMADQIEEDQTAAGFRNVADQFDDVGLGQVMRHAD